MGKSTVRLKRTSPGPHSECIFQCPVAATTVKIGREAAESWWCRLETLRNLLQIKIDNNSERHPIRHNIFRTYLCLTFTFNRLCNAIKKKVREITKLRTQVRWIHTIDGGSRPLLVPITFFSCSNVRWLMFQFALSLKVSENTIIPSLKEFW